MEFFIISMLNGLSYGLLLFMLSSGLTLIFRVMGVLNFAHASFYMIGAYFGHTLSGWIGFWPALVLAPLMVGACGALFERITLRIENLDNNFNNIIKISPFIGELEMSGGNTQWALV